MDGDIVIVDNFSIGIHFPSYFFYMDRHLWANESKIKRGDILVFRHPLDNRLYIKRCVAISAVHYRYIYYKVRFIIQAFRDLQTLGTISHYD